jgi:hypothetical protein
MHTLISILKTCGRVLVGLERIVIALILTVGLSVYGLANYTATQGAGTTFGSVVIGGVHFFSNLVCDFTTANQCAAVKAASTAAATTDPALVVQNATEHADLATINTSVNSAVPCLNATTATTNTYTTGQTNPANCDLNGSLYVGQKSQYPAGATAITASATGTTAATTATLAGTAGKTTYICGYSIRANATAAATVTDTITGVITATLSSILWVAPLASGIGVDEQIFSPCIPASAANTGIAIVSGAPGAGGTVSSKGWGYQL